MVQDLNYDVLDIETSNDMLYSAEVFLDTSMEQESVEVTRKGNDEDKIVYHLEPSGFDETRSKDVFVKLENAEIVGTGREVLEDEMHNLMEDILTKYAHLDRSSEYDYTNGELTTL